MPDLYKPRGILEGQRAQQNIVDDAEDGSVRADSKRQNQNGDHAERAAFEKASKSKLQFPEQRLHSVLALC
jgi:hypothetical protein